MYLGVYSACVALRKWQQSKGRKRILISSLVVSPAPYDT